MLLSSLLLFATAFVNLQAAGPYDHAFDGASPVEWFHQRLHADDLPELYLVCDYKFQVQEHGVRSLAAQGWEELLISCTIVDVIRGPKKVGDRFVYRRYLEGKAKDLVKIDELLGRLRYVFFVEAPNGDRFVDPQDPTATWPFTPEFTKAAALHRHNRAEQGAGQPATAPESKPEGREKPQPESKAAPR